MILMVDTVTVWNVGGMYQTARAASQQTTDAAKMKSHTSTGYEV
jgi:hypothetical protein